MTLIILDLDQTIVDYSNNYIHFRPGSKVLIKYLMDSNISVGIWSLGQENYVSRIIEEINKFFDFNPIFILCNYNNIKYIDLLDREKSIDFNRGYYKELNFLVSLYEIDMNRTILIDDNINNILANNERNTIKVTPWFYGVEDNELINAANIIYYLRRYSNY